MTGMTGREVFHHRKDMLWKEVFKDPFEWWNNCSSKGSPKQPDFNHNVTKEPLWMDNCNNPSWTMEELMSHALVAEHQCIGPMTNPRAGEALLPSLEWAYRKSKDLRRGNRIHNELKGCLVDENYSDAFINIYTKCGELKKAQGLLDMHNSSSSISWNALIIGYVRDGKGKSAVDCFERMEREGIPPNAMTYACTLKACAVIGNIDKGKQIHNDISRRGLLEYDMGLGIALVDMYAKCGALRQARSVLEKLPSRNVVSWSALIAGYAQKGHGQQALDCFEQMQQEGILPNEVTYACILKACAVIGAIAKGKQIHDEISRQGLLEHNIVLGGALVDMYAKCGALHQAQSVLEKLSSRNVVSWSALIAGYAQNGQGQEALDCFIQMRHEGILPNEKTYSCVLKACAMIGAIDKGEQIHDEILRQGLLQRDIVLGNALVDMYANCGALCQAGSVLKIMPSRDVISWNALIAGYAQNQQGQQALYCFEQMQHEGILPNDVTYVFILKACAAIRAIEKGKQIHDKVLRQGLLEYHSVLGGALMDMYVKCGALCQVQSVIEKLTFRNVVAWNSMIATYARNRQGQQGLVCFKRMQLEGILPNEVTYACVLKACALIRAIDKGKQVHVEILRQRLLQHDRVLGNALVDMYAKCAALHQAQNVLERLPSRDDVSWNTLIAGYTQNGQGQQALDCFEEMQHEGILPSEVTYACILKACAVIRAIDRGKQIHDDIVKQGFLQHDTVLGNALVEMYAKCGALCQAQNVLDKLSSRNVVSWNALIVGYAQNQQGYQALDCFERMQQEGILPSEVSYACILKACAVIEAIDEGKQIHDEILRQGLLVEHCSVLGGALVGMYVKCGALRQAQSVLDRLPSRNVVTWSALIAGYVENEQGEQALDCFEQMQGEGILPDEVTYACILKACALIEAIDKGKRIHDEISRQGLLEHHTVLGGALVDMYAKCGALCQAHSVLEKLPLRNVISWSALIAGYVQNGQGERALDCFEQMQHEGILPNEVTFHCLLNLCSHFGLVEKGQELFDSMDAMYGLKPNVESFACLVDLLGRAGHLAKAAEIIQGMPFSTDFALRHCLLGACRKWVDVNMGTWAFEQAVKLNKWDGSTYVLMVSIYTAAGML